MYVVLFGAVGYKATAFHRRMKYALGEITGEEYIQKSESNVQKIQMIKAEIAGQEDRQKEAADQLIALPETGTECLTELVCKAECLTKEIASAFIKSITVFSDKRIEIKWNFRDELVQFVEEQQSAEIFSDCKGNP